MRSWAAGASASSKRLSITGAIVPAATWGSISAENWRVTAIFSSMGRARRVVPIRAARLSISPAGLNGTGEPAMVPTWTMRPLMRRHLTLRGR